MQDVLQKFNLHENVNTNLDLSSHRALQCRKLQKRIAEL